MLKPIVPWFEPSSVYFLNTYPQGHKCFEEVGWFPLCEKFQGHNFKATMDFADNFNGIVACFNQLEIPISKHSISQCTNLP